MIQVVEEIEKEMKKEKRRKKRIFSQLLFREVTFWVRLVNGHNQIVSNEMEDDNCECGSEDHETSNRF